MVGFCVVAQLHQKEWASLSDRDFLVLVQLLIRCTTSKLSLHSCLSDTTVRKVLSHLCWLPLCLSILILGSVLCHRSQQIYLALSFVGCFCVGIFKVCIATVRLTWRRDGMSMSGVLLVVPVYCSEKLSSLTSSTGRFCSSLIHSEKLKNLRAQALSYLALQRILKSINQTWVFEVQTKLCDCISRCNIKLQGGWFRFLTHLGSLKTVKRCYWQKHFLFSWYPFALRITCTA